MSISGTLSQSQRDSILKSAEGLYEYLKVRGNSDSRTLSQS